MRDRSSTGDSRAREQSRREVELLKFVNKVDHDSGFIVRMIDHFNYKKGFKKARPAHFNCLVFESLH